MKPISTIEKITKDIEIVIFPNGFRMIHQKPKHNLDITSIHAFVKVGSGYETNGIRGVSHFVEHMCFKGTHKIPQAFDIFTNYDKIGAYFNAYTEKQFTCYTIKCQDEYVENCTHVLSDMLMNSIYNSKEFEKEQKVVIEENIRNVNNFFYELFNKMESVIYRGSSYEYTVDDISYHPKKKPFDYQTVVQWYRWFYQPNNMVFSVVSHLSIEYLKKIILSSYFYKSSNYHDSHLLKQPPSFALPYPFLYLSRNLNNQKEVHTILKKGSSTNYICIGFRTCDRNSPDRYIFKIIKRILNGFSGRLFMTLREKNGLTYSSNVYTDYLENTGYFLIFTQTDPNKTFEYHLPSDSKKKNPYLGVFPMILKMLADLKKNGIDESDLKISKGYLKGKYMLNMENNDNLASYNGINMILEENDFKSHYIPFSNIYKEKIENIKKSDVNRVIQTYMQEEHLLIGILGDKLYSKDKINRVVNTYFSNS
jgi:predicted Zn-dependent peptidase